jgi:hypothetical protein
MPECLAPRVRPAVIPQRIRRRTAEDRGPLDESVQGVDSGEDAAGYAHVGADEAAVRKQIGLEDEQDQGAGAGGESEHLGSGEKHKERQHDAKKAHGQAGAKEEFVGVVGIEELVAAEEAGRAEVRVNRGRRFQVQGH